MDIVTKPSFRYIYSKPCLNPFCRGNTVHLCKCYDKCSHTFCEKCQKKQPQNNNIHNISNQIVNQVRVINLYRIPMLNNIIRYIIKFVTRF